MFEFPGHVRWIGRHTRNLVAARLASLPAQPVGRIMDGAHVLDAESQAMLDDLTHAIASRTSVQLDIVTVPSLQGMTVEDFAFKLFNTWKLGQKGRNNGVLLLIAPVERKVRIEVGYGLEAELPDGLCGDIIRTSLVPAFKAGRFGPGAVAAVRGIGEIVGGLARDAGPHLASAEAQAGIRQVFDGAHLLTPKALEMTAHEAGLIRERNNIDLYVQTVPSLTGRPIADEARSRLALLPLDPARRARAILLLVARQENAAAIAIGPGLGTAISQPQADRLARGLATELGQGNVLGAFWSTTADLDQLLDGRITMLGLPRTPDQADRARARLRHVDGIGLVSLTLFIGAFVAFGTGMLMLGWASRTVFPLVFGFVFAAVPVAILAAQPVALGIWWPLVILAGCAVVGGTIGVTAGGWRPAYLAKDGRISNWARGGSWSSGKRGSGWSWGGGGGFGGSGGSGGGGGGGSSGGGGASGGW